MFVVFRTQYLAGKNEQQSNTTHCSAHQCPVSVSALIYFYLCICLSSNTSSSPASRRATTLHLIIDSPTTPAENTRCNGSLDEPIGLHNGYLCIISSSSRSSRSSSVILLIFLCLLECVLRERDGNVILYLCTFVLVVLNWVLVHLSYAPLVVGTNSTLPEMNSCHPHL